MVQEILNSLEKKTIELQVIENLKTCYDPEIPVNIYDMGLIYGINIDDSGEVQIKMTLTTPYCPAIQSLPEEIREKLTSILGVKSVKVTVVWDPPWDPAKMTDAARLELGMM